MNNSGEAGDWEIIQPYVKSQGIFICPSNPNNSRYNYADATSVNNVHANYYRVSYFSHRLVRQKSL